MCIVDLDVLLPGCTSSTWGDKKQLCMIEAKNYVEAGFVLWCFWYLDTENVAVMATDQARIATSAEGLLSPITIILLMVTDSCWPGFVFVASR
jgi:hypothetical protein